jgi:winged helix DNA-binding protein
MTDSPDAMDSPVSSIVAQRLYNQYLSRPGLATPVEVVRWFGAVQAQELPGARYALGRRIPGATEEVIERAVAARAIVRTWPMRGTIHFVPAEDTHWMLDLMARRTNQKAASIYRRAGLQPIDFARAGEVISGALRGGRALTRKALYTELDVAGLATGGERRGLHMLGYWAREGLICLGPRQGAQPTYTVLDEWVPTPRRLEGDAALAELTRRYFTSHGPATDYDFAWWSGLTLTEVRRGLALVEDEFARQNIAGRTYWGVEPPASLPSPAGSVSLLPQYDEYTVAYRDRAATRHPAFPDDAFLILGPAVVVDGLVAGTWKRTLTKGGVSLAITLYAPLDKRRRAALDQAVADYGRFHGLPANMDMRIAEG